MMLAGPILAAVLLGQEPVPQAPLPEPPAGQAPVPQEPAPVVETDPAPTPAIEAPDEGWRNLDEVIQIVNEDMLTSRALLREMYFENRRKPFANEEEVRRKERELHVERVKEALQVQAGQDMGLDPAEIDRRVKDILEREMARRSSVGLSADLKERSMTLVEFQEGLKDRLYATFWDNYVTGNGSLGAARQSRDVYVRPGYLRYCYRRCLENRELLPVIGGREQTVVLQQIFIDPQANGGPEMARSLAEDLRARIVAGEDMGDLVERYDSRKDKQKRGITEPLLESSVQRLDPAVGAFLGTAQPGDLSKVLEFKGKSHNVWRIVSLVERTPAVVPELSSIEVQKKLLKRAGEDIENWRREQGFKDLFRASYVWPPEFAQQ